MEEKTVVTGNNSVVEEKKPKKKSKKIWIALIGVVLALFVGVVILLAAGIAAILLWPKSVYLNDYVKVEFDGYDTIGSGQVIFDREAFVEEYEDKIKFSGKAKDYGFHTNGSSGRSPAREFADLISVSLDDADDLSNGQEVALVWYFQGYELGEIFNYDIEYDEATYTVQGLEPVEMFDPFENLEVSFSGISPDGIVNLMMKDYSDVYESAYFSADKAFGLSNGDVITITFYTNGDPVEYCTEYYGICPSVTSKEYTVEGLEEYVSSLSQISVDAENAMIVQSTDVFNAYVANKWVDGCTVDNFSYLGSYFLKAKEGMGEHESKYYMVYKVNATWKYEHEYWKEKVTIQPVEFYYVVEFAVPIIDKDGNCVADITSYSVCDNVISHTITKEGLYIGSRDITLYTVGYWTLEDVFLALVQSKVDVYSYETNISTQ